MLRGNTNNFPAGGKTILEQMQNNNNENNSDTRSKKQEAAMSLATNKELDRHLEFEESSSAVALIPPSISPMSLDSPSLSATSLSNSPIFSATPESSPLFPQVTHSTPQTPPTPATTSTPPSMFALLSTFLSSSNASVCVNETRNDRVDFPPDATLLLSSHDVAELNDFLKLFPDMRCVFQSPEDILHALRVVGSLKPQQRLSTTRGMYLQSDHKPASPWHVPLFLVRWWTNEDRQQNLQAVKCVLFGALWMMDDALKQCDLAKKPDDFSLRVQVQLQQVRFRQLFERLREAILEALKGLQNLKQTYCDDAHTCARIDTMAESVRDRLVLAAEGLKLLYHASGNVNEK